jgi:mannose-6-phosphate isomerase-like protein (cupin superfamily)
MHHAVRGPRDESAAGGHAACPAHHLHSEMWLIREGTVELMINSKSHLLGPGSGFVHSNEEHGVKNIGAAPATCLVLVAGPGAGL